MKSKNWQRLQAKIPITQFLLLLLFSTILLFSCKKEINYDEVENPSVEAFLKLPENGPKELTTVTGELKKQLLKKNFINEFVQLNGIPNWQHALKLKAQAHTNFTVIVPVIKAGIINTFFAATQNKSGKIIFEMHRKDTSSNTEYSYINLSAKKVANFFEHFKKKFSNDDSVVLKSPTKQQPSQPSQYCWWEVRSCTNTYSAVSGGGGGPGCHVWVEICEDWPDEGPVGGGEGGGEGGGGGGGGGGCTICPPPPCYTSVWYYYVLPEGCGGGHGWGENAPGDKLCSGSFNLRAGNDNSFWETNMTNLKFEDAAGNVNNFSAYFDLHNGLTDFTMNQVIYPSPYGTGVPPKSALEYLHDFFPDLFTSGDITSLWENGILIWRFSKYAAQKIVNKCSNTAGFSVTLQYPGLSAQSGFIPAQTSFRSQAQALIRCFMPTSVCRLTPSASSNVSYASYSPLCN